jgi:hypothetical protein
MNTGRVTDETFDTRAFVVEKKVRGVRSYEGA